MPFRTVAVTAIRYLYVLLFVYAAVSKLLDFENFQVQLGQSPLLSVLAGALAWLVPLLELLLAVLLCIPRFARLGLFGGFVLMALFTSYLIVILRYADQVPCSCGGILEDMSWQQHLYFNIVFGLLAAVACLLRSRDWRRTLAVLSVGSMGSLALMGVLFLYTTSQMQYENPFIRRFPQGTAVKRGDVDLGTTSKYFAGTDGRTLYLGDHRAPLHVRAYDTALQTVQQYKIALDREDFPFAAVQVRIDAPHFYLMDGTVPVVYKGNISDWKAEVVLYDTGHYFSRAEVMTSNRFVFRAQDRPTSEHVLGTLQFGDRVEAEHAPDLLERQLDGFFDTDGMLHYDRLHDKMTYLYYYRNAYIVADSSLHPIRRGTTIDTTTKAKLHIVHVKETRQRKIASVGATVNKVSAVYNDRLFVNSKVMGRFEPKEMWKAASVVDVYALDDGRYLSSFYVYDVDGAKVHGLSVSGHHLYALIGQHLHHYVLEESILGGTAPL